MKLKIISIFVFLSITIAAAVPPADSLFLKPGKYINSDNPVIKEKAAFLVKGHKTESAKVRAIYEYVRDSYSDSVYMSYFASDIINAGGNLCYQRAILLAALCRAAGIPARLHWQRVTLKSYMSDNGTYSDYIFIHGITGIKLNGRWYLYEPVGNAAKWKVWTQKDEKKIVEFKHNSDCLFSSTENVLIKTLPVYFADYDEIFPTLYTKLISGDMVLEEDFNR